jgi:hypothetical protein
VPSPRQQAAPPSCLLPRRLARWPPRGLAHAMRLPATTGLDDCCKGSLMLRARRPPHAHPRWLAAVIRPGRTSRAGSAAIRPGCAARARRRRRRCACVLALLAGRQCSSAAAIRLGLAGLAAIRPVCCACSLEAMPLHVRACSASRVGTVRMCAHSASSAALACSLC